MNHAHSPGRRRLLKYALASAGLAAWHPAPRAHEMAELLPGGPPVPDQPLRQITPHVWFIQAAEGFPTPANQGLMCNISFVIGKKGVVVVDSGASLQIGEMAIRQLKKLTDKPVVGIINTHYHGDHWLGNHAFVEAWGTALPIYAHPVTRRAIQGEQGPLWQALMARTTDHAIRGTRTMPPNHEVGHGFELDLGDVRLKTHHYGKAHTGGDLCVEVPEDGLTCMGDVAMDRRIANMDDGSFPGTLRTFDALEKATATRLWLPAHGAPGEQVLKEYRALFTGIYASCEQGVKDGKTLSDAKALVLQDPRVASRAPHITGFDANIGKYASLAWLEAEENSL